MGLSGTYAIIFASSASGMHVGQAVAGAETAVLAFR
jgi:hypothetical protein